LRASSRVRRPFRHFLMHDFLLLVFALLSQSFFIFLFHLMLVARGPPPRPGGGGGGAWASFSQARQSQGSAAGQRSSM